MSNLYRRPFAALAAISIAQLMFVAQPGAQVAAPAPEAGSKPIRWLVPYPAGGSTDVVARAIGQQMAALTGRAVVIENKPGGASAIAAGDAARSAPDGATIVSGDNSTFVFNPLLVSKLSYKVEELAPIGLLARMPLVLVAGANAPYKSLADIAAAAKRDREAVKFATPGIGTPHHLAMEMLMARSGIAAVHVPYRGATAGIQDVLGGHIPLIVAVSVVGLPYFKSGELRPIAVFSAERLPSLPDVPTMLELGNSGVEIYAWQGLATSRATPKATIDRLSSLVNTALKNPETRKILDDSGVDVLGGSPDAMADYIRSETVVWRDVIRERGLKIE